MMSIAKVLHRGVQDLLHTARQAVNFVDEQHVAGIQVRQQRRQIAGLFNGRAGGNPDIDAQLVRDDGGERRLTQPRRPIQQDVVERFFAQPRRFDEHGQIFLDFGLADVLPQRPRAQRVFHFGVLRDVVRAGDAVFVVGVQVVGADGVALE